MRRSDGDYIWMRASGIPEKDDQDRVISLTGATIDISDRKRWEAEQRDREEYLRQVLDNQLAFVALMDSDGTTLEVNHAALKTAGVSREEAIGVKEWDQPWWNFSNESRRQIQQDYETVRDGGTVRRDTVVRIADDSSIEIEYMLSPVRDGEGKLCYIIASAVDISDRKTAERQLRVSEERYRALVDASAEIVWTTNPDGEVVEDSPSWREFTGQSYEDWQGWGWTKAVHPDDRKRTKQAWQAAVADTLPFHVDYRLRSHTGEYRWTTVRAVPVLDSDGSIREWVGLNIDIQAQKDAEEAVRKSEYHLSSAMEAAKAGYWEATPELEEFLASDLAKQLHGVPPDVEMTHQFAMNAIHPDDQSAVKDALMKSVQSRLPFAVEYRVEQPDGSFRWLASQAEIEPESNPTRLMGFVQDISEQKRVAEALRESDRRKDEFLATLAHELRNPLAPLRSGLEILRTCDDQPQVISETRETMGRQLSHMVALVDDLLDISRISKGKLKLRNEQVRLSSLVQDAVEICKPMIEDAGHDFAIELPEHDAVIQGDSHRLSQILSNLISNAVKYTPDGGNINLSVETDQAEATIIVRDDGIGIAPDQLERVFELFAQIDKPNDYGYAGLGIGLSLVRSLVDMHNGTLDVSSGGSGQGSTFTVRLPITEMATETATAPQENSHTDDTHRPLKVLVVDDNLAAAKTLGIVIKKWGNNVRTAVDGKAGFEEAQQFQPDVVLMDIGMPIMDGYAAAKAIRSESWGKIMKLVALTGWGQDEDLQKTREAGFDQHLVKPVEPDVIRKLLHEFTQNTDS